MSFGCVEAVDVNAVAAKAVRYFLFVMCVCVCVCVLGIKVPVYVYLCIFEQWNIRAFERRAQISIR